jgi:glycosyltransferase involved in cell wall biosynthesis
MRILLSTLSMSYLSGAPLYFYELARELKRQGHDITLVSEWDGQLTGHDGHCLKENLEKEGIKIKHILNGNSVFGDLDDPQDLIIASEKCSQGVISEIPNCPVINVIHSEYDCETPLDDCDRIIKYVCIRQSILEHIVNEHNIPRDKCVVIYNGVDRERFKARKKDKRNYEKVVVPCTLDTLREKFLNRVISTASRTGEYLFMDLTAERNLIKANMLV